MFRSLWNGFFERFGIYFPFSMPLFLLAVVPPFIMFLSPAWLAVFVFVLVLAWHVFVLWRLDFIIGREGQEMRPVFVAYSMWAVMSFLLMMAAFVVR